MREVFGESEALYDSAKVKKVEYSEEVDPDHSGNGKKSLISSKASWESMLRSGRENESLQKKELLQDC